MFFVHTLLFFQFSRTSTDVVEVPKFKNFLNGSNAVGQSESGCVAEAVSAIWAMGNKAGSHTLSLSLFHFPSPSPCTHVQAYLSVISLDLYRKSCFLKVASGYIKIETKNNSQGDDS